MKPRLRDVLARVVMMGVAITQNGCCCPEVDTSADVEFDRGDPDIAALIDRCVTNSADCNDLCMAALEEELGEDAMFYEIADCDVTPRPDGANVHVVYWDGSACGRAPDGLAPCADATQLANPVARWLARAAYLEAASVIAFTHLAADLVRHGAPRELIAAAIGAARDEVRHARLLRELVDHVLARDEARASMRYASAGSSSPVDGLASPSLRDANASSAESASRVPAVRVAPYHPASLRDLAMLNAIEGCARETIGAAVNLWQAQCARDPDIRAAFASIARDEITHAELAREVHAWASTRLDTRDIAAIEDARDSALANIAALEDARSTALSDDTSENDAHLALGLPDAHQTRALIAALAA